MTHIMSDKKEWIVGAFETAEALRELLNTPQLTGLHFEFDCEVDEIPKMTYRVNRLSLKEIEVKTI